MSRLVACSIMQFGLASIVSIVSGYLIILQHNGQTKLSHSPNRVNWICKVANLPNTRLRNWDKTTNYIKCAQGKSKRRWGRVHRRPYRCLIRTSWEKSLTALHSQRCSPLLFIIMKQFVVGRLVRRWMFFLLWSVTANDALATPGESDYQASTILKRLGEP